MQKISVGIGVLLSLTCSLAAAEEWKPTAPVEFIVPSGAGGAADIYARAIGQILVKQDLLNGQPFIISNKPSGNGAVALQSLNQKSGNPHTLTLLYTGLTIANLTGDLKVAPSDFTPVSVFLQETMAVAVRSDSKFKNARDLVSNLQHDPSNVRFGYLGHHVLLSLAKPLKAAGVDIKRLTLAPFRSSAEAINALIGGFVDVVPASTPNLIGMLASGRVRLLAVASSDRIGGVFASAPTWREQGVDSSFNSVYGLLLPKGVSSESVRFWEGTFQKLSTNPDWTALLERNGAKGIFMNHVETTNYFEKERAELGPLVQELGLRSN